jgi:hypothetical protein
MNSGSAGLCVVLVAALGWSRPEPTAMDRLQAEIEALRAAKIAWREIAWKTCLIEGLRESREKRKPAMLWIFIDRPTDDARC